MRRWGPDDEGDDRATRRWTPVLALAVGAVAVGLVVTTYIPAPHNGGDNAGYITLARSLLDGRYVDLWHAQAAPHTKYPPVFPAMLAALIALGATTWSALKAVPAAFTVLAVLMAYAWAARRRGPFVGAGVAVLTGLSSAFLWSSHWVLSDPTFVALTLTALWALDRAEGVGDRDGVAGSAATATPGAGAGRDSRLHSGWLVVGALAAVLAYFTRSAGLPLLAVVALWLGLRRRWGWLAAFAAVAGLPAAAWALRARSVGAVQYVSEFWMVDPYRPELGRVGLGGLAGRVADNLGGYVGTWVPEGLVGATGAWVGLLGLVLAALAVTGWARRLGRRPAAAELFFPLYAGLILLWPQVWSGDRFALPLFPLLLFYAAEALEWGMERWGRRAAQLALAAGVAVVGLPAAVSWTGAVSEATACGSAFRAGGTWACYGPAWGAFAEVARWSGANLPPGAAVLTRKPRLFWVMGGPPGATFPFTADPAAFLAEAEEVGARYVVLDYLDGQATRYVAGVLQLRPEAFCSVRTFSSGPDAPPTRLLGLVPPDSDLGGSIERQGDRLAAALPPCPADMRAVEETSPPALDPSVVPRLVEGR